MTDALLRCEQVSKSYTLGRTTLSVLRGVNLSVHRAQFVAIAGTSGSGKSTLLHVMSGLDVPQRGQVYYDGRPMFEPEALRKIPLGRESSFAEAAAGSVAPPLAPAAVYPPDRRVGRSHRSYRRFRNQRTATGATAHTER